MSDTVKHRWNFPITAALEYNILIAAQGGRIA